MIEADVEYLVRDNESFQNKVLPYIYGGGIFYKKVIEDLSKSDFKQKVRISIKSNTLSQFITILTGMLRYSNDCLLDRIYITDNNIKNSEYKLNINKSLIGLILKPSINYNTKIIKSLILAANRNKLDFIKDDDASEYSLKEFNKIKKLSGKVPYFSKVVNIKSLYGKYAMIVPWVDGWDLLQKASKQAVTISHCANLSPQISWYTHIIFSRLAGASIVIVPDTEFDNSFNLNSCLEAATINIKDVNTIRLIISGGINPNRINQIMNLVDKVIV